MPHEFTSDHQEQSKSEINIFLNWRNSVIIFLKTEDMWIILQNKASSRYDCQVPPEGFGNRHIHFLEKYCFSSDKHCYHRAVWVIPNDWSLLA